MHIYKKTEWKTLSTTNMNAIRKPNRKSNNNPKANPIANHICTSIGNPNGKPYATSIGKQ